MRVLYSSRRFCYVLLFSSPRKCRRQRVAVIPDYSILASEAAHAVGEVPFTLQDRNLE
jgi:hypothetical protein